MKTERGFALAMVMMLTIATAAIVIGSMRDMVLQERLTGNFQQTIAVRHAAEKGLFDTYNKVMDVVADSPTIGLKDILAQISDDGVITGEDSNGIAFHVDVTITEDGFLKISSRGFSGHGESVFAVRFRFDKGEAGEGRSSVTAGTVSCEKTRIEGWARVDAWDFSVGNYNSELVKPMNGESQLLLIKAIGRDAVLILRENGVVWGNAQSAKDITITDNTFIYGDLRAGGDANIGSRPSHNSPANMYPPYVAIDHNISVWGDVMLNGDLNYQGSRIRGGVRANNNLTIGAQWGANHKIYNMGRYKGREMALYGGEYKATMEAYPSELYQNGLPPLSDTLFRKNPELPEIPLAYSRNTAGHSPPPGLQINENVDITCEPVDLKSAIKKYRQTDAPDLIVNSASYRLTPQRGYISSGSGSLVLESEGEELPVGHIVNMHKVDRIGINGGTLQIGGGDVYLYAHDDIFMTGATIDIEEGSSLTIYGQGNIVFDSVHTNRQGVLKRDDGMVKPVFSIYSDHHTDQVTDPVQFKGSTDIYALIYMPRSSIEVTGNARIKGHIRAFSLVIRDFSAMTFDKRLPEVIDIPVGSPGALAFDGIVYE